MTALAMLQTSVILLVLAAAGGLVMAGIRFSGRPHPPSWLAMLHGLLAAGALTLLLYAACVAGLPRLAAYGLAVLIVAALGGLVLNLNYHWKRLALPVSLTVGHAALAVAGFILLLIPAFGPHGG
ncbi:MAG TPA: hypothetical protein VFA75_08025 [Nevskia sp.]|nr:hypothetical protein [Nevskia sp.]